MSRSGLRLGLTLGGIAAATALHALRREPVDVQLERVTLPVPCLPNDSGTVDVLFITDGHHWGWGTREDRVLELLKSETPPDLVVWGGDFLGSLDGIETAVRLATEVSRLFPGVPSIAVRGNAEHKVRPQERRHLEESFADCGVRTLVNENMRLSVQGADWRVAGTDDPYYGFCDLDATLAGVDPSDFVLLAAHSPQVAARVAKRGVDVLLSGHTHGGQVRVPGFGALRTQNPLSRRVDSGMFDGPRWEECLGPGEGVGMVGYVSRGLGVAYVPRLPWLAPRLFCPPEITRLTFARPVFETF